ncbi:MAG: signal peptidase I [Chlamydiae bacterium RIFCSPHIGHO2_12_FULL_27_8]|nr:MAG: signal peptidase I [Chlamydiae bacterium RIFCSPHIGHO2_12_FULL_27_8]
MFWKGIYSLRKSKKILRTINLLYKKKVKKLSDFQKMRFENLMIALKNAIHEKNIQAADRAAKNLENLSLESLKKSFFEKIFDSTLALAVAIIVAILVRQIYFELFSIPTGSMRPTLKEKDLLVVSKTDYSINVPLYPSHFYFNEELVHRGSIVVFTSANLDMADPNTMYFYLFPGKKQLVKRLIGKPGDQLYFYGGKIYGLDKNDHMIKEFQNSNWFQNLEHIPFISFEEKIKTSSQNFNGIYSNINFYQMNEPVAKLFINPTGTMESEIFIHQYSSKDKPRVKHYYDIFGMINYSMSRILTKEEVLKYSDSSLEGIGNYSYYLELIHHPTLENPKLIQDEFGRFRPAINYSTSLIPLDENAMKRIFENIYTARFCVKNEQGYNYGRSYTNLNSYPTLKNVEDGCYEIEKGKAYKVDFLGIRKKVDKNHPLNTFSNALTQTLYNNGIDFYKQFSPMKKNQTIRPKRYGYFRDQDFYLMNNIIFKKDDPLLVNFLQQEYKKQSENSSYKPFEDLGSPIDEKGNINENLIKKYGIVVPKKMYILFGDNYAQSADSRDFGFVCEENLKGGVNFVFWPPSQRWGKPLQPSYQIFTIPRLLIWTLGIIAIIISYIIVKKRNKIKF